MANVVIDIAAEYTGNKAFKQAETATQKLEKSVAKLGKQLLGVFAATKLIAFGKTEDDDNVGFKFATDKDIERDALLKLAKSTTEKITLKTANEGEVEGGDEVQTNVTEDWISIDEL